MSLYPHNYVNAASSILGHLSHEYTTYESEVTADTLGQIAAVLLDARLMDDKAVAPVMTEIPFFYGTNFHEVIFYGKKFESNRESFKADHVKTAMSDIINYGYNFA